MVSRYDRTRFIRSLKSKLDAQEIYDLALAKFNKMPAKDKLSEFAKYIEVKESKKEFKISIKNFASVYLDKIGGNFYLYSLVVGNKGTSALQRSGIGTLLLAKAKEIALHNKAHSIFLDCTIDKIPFYEKSGYKEITRNQHTVPISAVMQLVL